MISQEVYERILSVIGNHAIEDMFVTEEDVKDMIRMGKGEITADELIAENKRSWGVV